MGKGFLRTQRTAALSPSFGSHDLTKLVDLYIHERWGTALRGLSQQLGPLT